jgi:hypothetical protein
MPEFLDAYVRDGNHFATLLVVVKDERATFEFGVDQKAYKSIRKILEYRPFAVTPGVPHRYFFAGSYSKKEVDSDLCMFGVRIEGGRDAKTYDFVAPVSLAANLIWFAGLESLQETSGLRRLA